MRQNSSWSSSPGAWARSTPGVKVSASRSQWAQASGVRIEKAMLAKRRTKWGAVFSVTRCAGSNQAT